MRKNAASFLLALAVMPCIAQAAWTLRYEGPDVLTLMSRPNGAASNARSARVERREISRLGVALLLAQAFEVALAKCDVSGFDEVVVTPASVPDTLGDTTTHIQGLGMYVSLPSPGHGVGQANWFIAPYVAIQVQLVKDDKPIETRNPVFEFAELPVALEQETTEEEFFKVKTDAVEKSVYTFAKERMAAAMKTAFPKRCK